MPRHLGGSMQLSSLLAILNPSATSQPSSVNDDLSIGENQGASVFAQLLGDAEEKFAATDHGGQRPDPGAELKSGYSIGLLAQGLIASAVPMPQDIAPSAEVLAQPITQQQASAALQRLQMVSPQEAAEPFVAPLAAALTAIKTGDSKETIASLIARVSVTLPQHCTSAAPLIASVVRLIRPSSDVVVADVIPPQAKEKDQLPSALMQSLQASFFRPVDGSHASVEAKEPEEESSVDIVEIIPLNAVVVSAVPVPVSVPMTDDSASVHHDHHGVQAALDARIPPLALPAENTVPAHALGLAESTLPEVRLPAAVSAATTEGGLTDVPSSTAPATPGDSHFSAMLESLTKTNGNSAQVAAALAASSAATLPSDTKKDTRSATANSVDAPAMIPPAPAQVPAVTAEAPSSVRDHDATPSVNAALATSASTVARASLGSTGLEEDALSDSKTDTTIQSAGQSTATGAPHDVARSHAPITIAAPIVYKPVVEQVHVAITRATKDGANHLTIQLEPLELGRVEVSVHTGTDGQTHIAFMVDKPSTLDSLARHAHGLERSLQEAGVKADAGSMQFNLRQQPQTSDAGSNGAGNSQQQALYQQRDDLAIASLAQAATPAAAIRHYTLTVSDGIDIRA